MFLVSARKRNRDKSFGHEKLPKGRYAIYELRRASNGEGAEERSLEEIPTDKDTLLLVHGFNNDFERVSEAYLDFSRRIRGAGFPGHVIGFTWPSFGRWYLYYGDRDQVEHAAPALAGFLRRFLPRLAENSVHFHLNAHSMGAHLVLRALASYPARGPIVREVTCFAADVSNDDLERGGPGYRAARRATRLTSYFNRHDRVLAVSELANADGRLGLNGADDPELMPGNAFQVDCTTVVEGHSGYRDSSEVMRDLVSVLGGASSGQIPGRTAMAEKNSFRIGREEAA